MYLSGAVVRSLLRGVASLGTGSHELLMTFMDGVKGACSFHNATLLAEWWLDAQGEPFRWGCPRDDIERVLASAGFQLRNLHDHDNLRTEYLAPFPDASLAEGELVAHART